MTKSLLYDVVKQAPKIRRNFNFELEQKLDHHFYAKFHSDSDGDGFKAQKPIIDPLIGPNWP